MYNTFNNLLFSAMGERERERRAECGWSKLCICCQKGEEKGTTKKEKSESFLPLSLEPSYQCEFSSLFCCAFSSRRSQNSLSPTSRWCEGKSILPYFPSTESREMGKKKKSTKKKASHNFVSSSMAHRKVRERSSFTEKKSPAR